MMLLFHLIALLPLFSVSDGRVINLEIGGDPGNQRGYLLATINEFGVTFKTPVCGSVDTLTGEIGCVSVGWYVVTRTGTTRGFGINDDSQTPRISNLHCTGYTKNNGKKTFDCTYSNSTGTRCSGNQAAISCYWTLGQAVGLGIGLLALCLLLICVPICLCICCCCCGVCAGARGARKYDNL